MHGNAVTRSRYIPLIVSSVDSCRREARATRGRHLTCSFDDARRPHVASTHYRSGQQHRSSWAFREFFPNKSKTTLPYKLEKGDFRTNTRRRQRRTHIAFVSSRQSQWIISCWKPNAQAFETTKWSRKMIQVAALLEHFKSEEIIRGPF